jgi:release factor glutamine methyltransferase
MYHEMTVESILQSSVDELSQSNVPEPVASACHLLAAVLRLSWESGYRELQVLLESDSRHRSKNPTRTNESTLSGRTLTLEEATRFADLIDRRLRHEPIQYLVGQWDFLDSTFRIRSPLLCPRAETEELVLHAERDIRRRWFQDAATTTDDQTTTTTLIRVLDVGCGTGCVGISLLERLAATRDGSLASLQVEAIDVEPVAVNVSIDNAKRILGHSQVHVSTEDHDFMPGSSMNSYSARLVALQDYRPMQKFHVVVSNPPYIPLTDRDTLDANVRDFESPKALFGGHDGMDVIRDMMYKLPGWCHSDAVCWLEVDPSHPTLLRDWIEQQDPSLRSSVVFDSFQCDMFGLERFVRLRVNPIQAAPRS